MSDQQFFRRQILATVGVSGIVAGYVGTSDNRSETPADTPDPTDRDTPTDKLKATSTDTPTAEPDPTSTDNMEETTAGRESDIIYVDPAGDDSNPGSEANPLQTIKTALDRVQPGETVYLEPGEYRDRIVTIIPGEPENPITITGSKDAVIRPSEDIVEKHFYPVKIQHSHYRLAGVTITGLQTPSAPEQVDSYAKRLVQVSPRPDSSEYIEDVVFAPHGIGNSQTKLVSVVRAKDCEFGPFKMIGPAGVEYLYGDKVSHIGEILYIGQPLQVYADGADGYHWDTYDRTRDIHIHHIDNSEGYHHSELVDCKDGTENITVEYCTDAGGSQNNEPFTPQSIHVRGHHCTFRWNRLAGGAGNGIEVYKPGSDDVFPEFGFDEGVVERIATENEIYGNEIHDFEEFAVAFDDETRDAQQHVCGNDIRGETNGDPGKECPDDLPDSDEIGHTGGDSPYA